MSAATDHLALTEVSTPVSIRDLARAMAESVGDRLIFGFNRNGQDWRARRMDNAVEFGLGVYFWVETTSPFVDNPEENVFTGCHLYEAEFAAFLADQLRINDVRLANEGVAA